MAEPWVAWDASLSQQPDHAVYWQRGCPLGYYAQFVAPGTEGAAPSPSGNPSIWVRCRLMPQTQEEMQAQRDESGTSWAESWNVLLQAAKDTGLEIVAGATSFGKWAVIGLVALGAILLLREK